MTDNTQPEALRLAEEFEKDGWIAGTKQWCAEVSAELRRQHILLDEQQLTIAALNSCIGCETTTENLTAVGRLEARIAELEAQLAAIGAGGVSGPLVGQPQAMPDLSVLTERGAKAWAGVDAQGLREGGADMSKERDLMELVDAYAEARHIGGCHTYNAKTADARAKVVASLQSPGFTVADMATAAAQGFRDVVASLAASAGEPTEDVKQKIASNTWDHFGDILPTLKAISRGEWYWGANSRCKYIEIRLDTRDGGCLLYDRERVRISPEQFAHQHHRVRMEPWPASNSLAAPPTAQAEGWKDGIEAVAKMLEKKADDFAQRHGYGDMGSLSFGRGPHADAKLDHHSLLCELAEEVRGLTPPTSAEGVEHGPQ